MQDKRMEEKYIALNELMLDPNNPRFVLSFGNQVHFADDAIEGRQNDVLNHFTRDKSKSETDEFENGESDEFFDIEDLWNSISQIGLVPIDRIVVRKLKDSDKYLVIEGNRRIATAKLLLKKNDKEPNPDKKLSEKIKDSLQRIQTLCLNTEGMSPEEVNHRVAVILGLRHYGSVLEWKPLPKAYNIFTEYMGLDPRLDIFEYQNKRAGDVASRLSVKVTNVKKACMTYIVYQQLCNTFDGVNPHHYSLIEAAVVNKTLTGASGYFVINSSSFQMDEQSLAKMDDLCQFGERDNLANEDKIIPEPRDFKYLVKLVKASNSNPDESVKHHAAGLLNEVESGERGVESAADSLENFINQKQWTKALEDKLDKQEKDLDIDEFKPIGMELTHFKDVTNTFERLRRVLQI